MKFDDIEDNIAQNDKIEQYHKGDTRKPKLTLRHLHKLRKIRELKALEKANLSKQLELIYSVPDQAQEF